MEKLYLTNICKIPGKTTGGIPEENLEGKSRDEISEEITERICVRIPRIRREILALIPGEMPLDIFGRITVGSLRNH